MKKIFFISSICVFLFISCKKEKFPNKDDLTGNWIEQTNQSFRYRLIFENETMYIIKSTKTDTLLFRLDKKQEVIILSSSSGESSHKLLLNKKEKTLTIWGLFLSIPENITMTKFVME